MPWVADGIVDPESSALDHLRNIAGRDGELARRMLGYDWLADGPDSPGKRGYGAWTAWQAGTWPWQGWWPTIRGSPTVSSTARIPG